MTTPRALLATIACLITLTGARGADSPSDEQAIRALYERFSTAVEKKDLRAIMSFYAPDARAVYLDAFVPLRYVGAAAYQKSYETFFAEYPGPSRSEISDLRITVAGPVAYAHGVDTWAVTAKNGQRSDVAMRFTDVFSKRQGKWLVVHEHLSFPVDPMTGKADLLSKR